jgi:hypothetical protein
MNATHRLRRSTPRALETIGLLSLVRRLGLRRSRQLLTLAAMTYLKQQEHGPRKPRRR